MEATFDAEVVEPVLTVGSTAGHGAEHFITVEDQYLDECVLVKFDLKTFSDSWRWEVVT